MTNYSEVENAAQVILEINGFDFGFRLVILKKVPSTGKRGAGPDVFWAGRETDDVSK